MEHGLCDDSRAVLARIKWCGSLEEAVEGAGFVQENGPENVEIKRHIYADLDRLAPAEAILASSTSGIVASLFTENLEGRCRCVVGHPVNPPHLIPLVEICGAPWTSQEVIDRAHLVYTEIGLVPVIIKKEIAGFALNRIQGAVLAEAFRLVHDGIISADDLDKTMNDGLGLRWSFMGPFETIDLNAPGGIADYCNRYLDLYRGLADAPPSSSVFNKDATDKIIADFARPADSARLKSATAQRNSRLAALRAHKNSLR